MPGLICKNGFFYEIMVVTCPSNVSGCQFSRLGPLDVLEGREACLRKLPGNSWLRKKAYDKYREYRNITTDSLKTRFYDGIRDEFTKNDGKLWSLNKARDETWIQVLSERKIHKIISTRFTNLNRKKRARSEVPDNSTPTSSENDGESSTDNENNYSKARMENKRSRIDRQIDFKSEAEANGQQSTSVEASAGFRNTNIDNEDSAFLDNFNVEGLDQDLIRELEHYYVEDGVLNDVVGDQPAHNMPEVPAQVAENQEENVQDCILDQNRKEPHVPGAIAKLKWSSPVRVVVKLIDDKKSVVLNKPFDNQLLDGKLDGKNLKILDDEGDEMEAMLISDIQENYYVKFKSIRYRVAEIKKP
eukprot:CAMPEP_0116148614 /NCGR_PEP_ID=MMETSP0329-20121206/18471_1 /TAXON_ID=697910 /ORGANISM="Pseudo-nitzschia arenysensis, Strain B593" /LENGTH=358 /DNA_ID=CAMNT_0003644799 /DNA_START=639 /DNA_END=1715 /DNA_ORIENTATION=+